MAVTNLQGALYEVAIIGFDGEIADDIVPALLAAGIDINLDESESRGKESSVFVNPDCVGQAVKIINDLGYETDEDDE